MDDGLPNDPARTRREVRCGTCGRLLGLRLEKTGEFAADLRCPSCKTTQVIRLTGYADRAPLPPTTRPPWKTRAEEGRRDR